MKFKILAICGSLKANSSNQKILKEAIRLSPADLEISLYEKIAEIPHFNPDLDIEPAPLEVQNFRRLLQASQGVLISSPEYAHGIPGAYKNAMDWTVSSGDFDRMPVVLINASTTGGEFAGPQMIENLKVMGAKVLQTSSIQTPVVRKAFDENGLLIDANVIQSLKESLLALRNELFLKKKPS